MEKKKNMNSGIFAVFVTVLICIAVLIAVLIRGNMESKEKVSSKKPSALHVATPEALDVGFFMSPSSTKNSLTQRTRSSSRAYRITREKIKATVSSVAFFIDKNHFTGYCI